MAEIDKGKILKEAFEYQHKGQHDRAIDELRKILKVYPRDTRTLQKVAELQSKKGDRKEAVKSYNQLAEIYEKDGFVDFAISVYKTVLKMDDGLSDVHLKLGKLSLKKNLRGEALVSLQTALKLCGDNKTEKEEILEKIIEANPGDASTIERLADHYYNVGKADPAKDVLRKGAEAMKSALNLDGAHKFYEKILNIDPKDELALKAVAELEACAGKPKGAADIYERILESNPNDIEVLKKAAELYSGMGDAEAERAKLCLRRLASFYKLTNSDSDLREVYEKILCLDPSDPEAIEYMDRMNRVSEIKIDESFREESELKTEAFSFSDNLHSLGQEHREENNEKLQSILDSEPKYAGPADSLNLPLPRPDVSSKDKLVETVDERELKKTRVGWEEESNVLDINRENYRKSEKTETQDAITFKRANTENLNKSTNSAFYERGIAYKDMKMSEQAVAEFRRSIGEGYKVPESYMMIGLCFLQRGDGKKALGWFQKGLSIDGLAVEQVISLKSGSALALVVIGSVSDALKLLEEIIEDYQ
jgi:tetratricopeptide (TPR) repeat protein